MPSFVGYADRAEAGGYAVEELRVSESMLAIIVYY
jgi:hypothetical protein